MSAKKSPSNPDSGGKALVYEDVSLNRRYPVMEIAMLAAVAKNVTGIEKGRASA